MKTNRTALLTCTIAICALQVAILHSPAQTKVLINAFNTTNEVTNPSNGQAWQNWFGTAYYQVLWDASDASNNVNSGSLQIQAFYPDSGIGGCCGPQFVAMDGYSGINPPLVGNGGPASAALATNVEFDIRFDPSSFYDTNSGTWPAIEVGTRGTGFNQYDFGNLSGAMAIPVTNTNWVHVSMPISASANWTNIPNIYFKYYSASATGWLKLFVDNIFFTTAPVPVVPPTLKIAKANRGLRMLAGPAEFNRGQLVAVDENQSWVGGTNPVTYSFTISGYDVSPPLNEFHVFFIPLNYDQGAIVNAFTDYSTASNNLRLQIVGTVGTTVTANLAWKTNLTGSNPTNVVLTITNPTAIGTWTVTFDSDTNGTLTAPGAAPAPFSLPPDVAATFANPLALFLGVQPNPIPAIGQSVDLAGVQTSGIAAPGVPINTDFTSTSTLDTNIWGVYATQDATLLVLVTNTTSWWIDSSFPDYGAVVSTVPDLSGSIPWSTPAYYTGYNTNGYFQRTLGTRTSRLLPAADLPSVDGTSNGVKAASAFFRLQLPAPAQ